jgi:hypothetical protein
MTTHMKHIATSLVATLSAAGCVDSHDTDATQAESVPTARADRNPGLFPPTAQPYGLSIEQWAENWWRWGLGIPLDQNPNDTATASHDVHQAGPVYFLANPPAGGSTSFTVPQDTAIAVILSSILNDYPCPDPTFQPAPGQTLLDFLLGGAVAADNVASITGTLDGKSLGDLGQFHFTSKQLMTFTGDPSLAVLDNCITGSPEVAAIEAHFILVKPLDPGIHVLSTHLITTAGVAHDRTSTITVP